MQGKGGETGGAAAWAAPPRNRAGGVFEPGTGPETVTLEEARPGPPAWTAAPPTPGGSFAAPGRRAAAPRPTAAAPGGPVGRCGCRWSRARTVGQGRARGRG